LTKTVQYKLFAFGIRANILGKLRVRESVRPAGYQI